MSNRSCIQPWMWLACLWVAVSLIAGGLFAADAPTSAPVQPLRILMTADNEGQTRPCSHCPVGVGLGGMARRATAIDRARQDHPLLLLDAGNALFGGDSTDGRIIIAAFNALHYDALNVSYRDFRHGKQATLQALKEAKFPVLSANLMDEKTGKPLFLPYVIRTLGGQNVALIGLCEPPAGLDLLPHLQAQLAGIRIDDPIESLAHWLSEIKPQAGQVIVLYYGTPAGTQAVCRAYGRQIAAIGAGGFGPDDLPADDKAVLFAADPHGKSLADVRLGNESSIGQLRIDPSLPEDPQMQKLLAH